MFRIRSHRLSTLLISTFAALSSGAGLAAQFEVDRDFMETLEDKTRSLNSRLALKESAGARDDARALAAMYEKMALFYSQQREASDAVTWSNQGKDLSNEISRYAVAKEFDRALQSAAMLGNTCTTCHRVYKNQ